MAGLQALSPWANTWKRILVVRFFIVSLAYAILANGLGQSEPLLALAAIIAGTLCISGVYQIVWYSEMTHLHIIAMAFWAQHPPKMPLEIIAFGAAGVLLIFQRPNVAWVFASALALAMALAWTPIQISLACMGAIIALIGIHFLLPHYALYSLKRYFGLRRRMRESWFFSAGPDVWMFIRWAMVYGTLAATTVWVILLHSSSLLQETNVQNIIGCGMVAAAFFGLKLSNDVKEPDFFLFLLGLFWIDQLGHPRFPAVGNTSLIWTSLFIGLGLSAGTSMARAERTRLQTYFPLSRVPIIQRSWLENRFIKLAPRSISINLGSTLHGRDRYAARGDRLSCLSSGRLQGLNCGLRMRETISEFTSAVACLGPSRPYVLGPDIEWLAFANGIPSVSGTPPAWHKENMYLAEDVPAILQAFRGYEHPVFVFTYKEQLKWMEYNYDKELIDFFQNNLVLLHQTQWLMFFGRKGPSTKLGVN